MGLGDYESIQISILLPILKAKGYSKVIIKVIHRRASANDV